MTRCLIWNEKLKKRKEKKRERESRKEEGRVNNSAWHDSIFAAIHAKRDFQKLLTINGQIMGLDRRSSSNLLQRWMDCPIKQVYCSRNVFQRATYLRQNSQYYECLKIILHEFYFLSTSYETIMNYFARYKESKNKRIDDWYSAQRIHEKYQIFSVYEIY